MKAPFDTTTLRQNFRQITIGLLVGLAIIGYFLSQSRMPGLDTKAQMGQRTNVGSIVFDIVLPVDPGDPWWQRVAFTAVNWAHTNWKGMTFGLLFAAALLAVLRYFPRHAFGNRLLNTLKGVLTGAPLGVCVNCATPIAHGMYRAGVRTETVLATLVSSPTLNVIVLAMSFSLLPLHFAIAKLVAVLAFIAVVVPLLARRFEPGLDRATNSRIEEQLARSPYARGLLARDAAELPALAEATTPGQVGWLQAAWIFARDYLRALWFIARTTVPLMLLAGLLGALVVESLPVKELSGLEVGLPAAIAVAIVGAFMPVPMSFDVITTSLLIGSGVPPLFAMTLLFTLGIFSIYPFMVIARNMSLKLALAMFAAVVGVGLLTGYAVQAWEGRVNARAVAAFEDAAAPAAPAPVDFAARLATVERICADGAAGDEREACLADYVVAGLESGAGAPLCAALSGPGREGLREFCLAQQREREIVEEARLRADTAACAPLPTSGQQLACMQAVIVSRLNAGEEIAYCATLPSPAGQAWCRQKAIGIRLEKFNDVEVCGQLAEAGERAACATSARIAELASGRRFEDCAALSGAADRVQCRRMVAYGLLDDGADAGVCARIDEAAAMAECRVHAAVVVAARTGDPATCGAIGDAEGARVCRRVARNQRVQLELDRAASQSLDAALAAQRDPAAVQRVRATIAPAAARRLEPRPWLEFGPVSVRYVPHAPRAPGASGFARREGAEFGIPDVWRFTMLEFVSPFMVGRGIASGDFDNDRWPDLLLASNDGVHLLRNLGGGRFSEQPLPAALDLPREAFTVAFVDLDNDGWQDLFVAGYGGSVRVVLNDRAGFRSPRVVAVDNPDAILAVSAGFADIDRDGDLDFMLGNWSYGEDKAFLETHSRNLLVINDAAGGFTGQRLDEIRGDSLSTLLSDLDQDGNVDLAVANDREIPDMFYRGDGRGEFRRVRRADHWIPLTPLNTMSIDAADLDNDLRMDLFSTDMTFSRGEDQGYCQALPEGIARTRCELLLEGRERIARRDSGWCASLPDIRDRGECLTAIFRSVAITTGEIGLCDRIPDGYAGHREYCRNLARKEPRIERFAVEAELPQKQRNVLLLGTANGGFRDATDEYGVGSSYWTWNAKAADLDNDGWQDLYVGNGFRFGEGEWEIHSNVLYHNQAGRRFVRAEREFGLEDRINTPSFVEVDFDLDGDLDLIATGVLAPVRVYVNGESRHNAVSFALDDLRGNRFGIGSRIYVHYRSADGKPARQVREIKASGGYQSFVAPVAHFGLGDAVTIDKVEVRWSTGQTSVLEGDFPANRHYLVERRDAAPR